jgi:hypothetical protein
MVDMEPQRDVRWKNMLGGRNDFGLIVPMSFEVLSNLAAEWVEILPPEFGEDHGPIALLRMARSLFAYAWFDYEFMTVACLIAFQAMEAAFHVLYPEASEKTPCKKLVRDACADGTLSSDLADIAETGVELRNAFSHPMTHAALTLPMAVSMLETTHRLVALLMSAAPHGPVRHLSHDSVAP